MGAKAIPRASQGSPKRTKGSTVVSQKATTGGPEGVQGAPWRPRRTSKAAYINKNSRSTAPRSLYVILSATVPLARSGVFGPGTSCHNFQSSSLCFPSTSLHLPSSSLQPLADGPLAMADGQSSMVNGPLAGSMVHLPWFIFHFREPHPHYPHPSRDLLDPSFLMFFE